jgi:hypothetical protein
MRIATVVIASVFSLPLVFAACGGSDDNDSEPFDTLQACYDDHHSGAESLPVQQAIVVCCIDHPIAGVHPSCLDSQAACVGHVRAALDTTVTDNDISAACTTYISEK